MHYSKWFCLKLNFDAAKMHKSVYIITDQKYIMYNCVSSIVYTRDFVVTDII
jgi:hypothetical protein